MRTTGWRWLFNSSREHWFDAEGKSACGKWFTFSAQRRDEPGVKEPCVKCLKARERAADAPEDVK